MGWKKTEDGYKRRTNREINKLYKEPIRHSIKGEETAVVGLNRKDGRWQCTKDIAWKTPDYKKKKGKLRERWQAVIQDLKEKNITNWKLKVMDRKGVEKVNRVMA